MSSLSPHYSATHEEAGCLVRTYGHRCWKTAHLSSSIIISQLASFPSSHLRLGRAGVYVHYTHVKLIALVGYKSVVLAQDFWKSVQILQQEFLRRPSAVAAESWSLYWRSGVGFTSIIRVEQASRTVYITAFFCHWPPHSESVGFRPHLMQSPFSRGISSERPILDE